MRTVGYKKDEEAPSQNIIPAFQVLDFHSSTIHSSSTITKIKMHFQAALSIIPLIASGALSLPVLVEGELNHCLKTFIQC